MAVIAVLLAGCGQARQSLLPPPPGSNHSLRPEIRPGPDGTCRTDPSTAPTYADWPSIKSDIRKDPAMEAKIADQVAGMSLAEKVGQMTQPEIHSITPDEVRKYFIGSVLSGGGSWPGRNKHASAKDWLTSADAFWDASMSTTAKVKIPVIWGIDAVHGHGNVFGATSFPHNIGLGAARDPCLIRRIGEATAQQIRVTGQDWTFAPVLAVVRDDRWGRTYEAFSENPAITRDYASELIKGLQGTEKDRYRLGEPGSDSAGTKLSLGKHGVIATAKHFIGDGGTDAGTDQGVNKSTEAEMINVHGQGYYGALAAGVQSVMVSFNSWTNTGLGITEGKIHGSKRLLNDVLKQKLGFDGLIVSDWNGIGQVSSCSNPRCAQAINAGIDIFMVPEDWKAFIANTIDLVQQGEVPVARIDDAVTRILRVKFRAGLFQQPKPSQREFAGDPSQLVHRELARQAVQESLVLLKNNNSVLPLSRGQKILVVGKNADNLPNQTGGWSLTWQGTGNSNADFPNGDTILAGIRKTVGEANVAFSETADAVNVADYKAVIAVIGETPYAEGNGDISKTKTLAHAALYPADLAVLNKVSGKGVPVVTVFVSGRPLYTSKELNRSDAFVAAWLPGTEGAGIADLLFRDAQGKVNKDFGGKLSYSWPKSACQTPLNVGDAAYDPLFPFGYGLTYATPQAVPVLDETTPTLGCGATGGGGTATGKLDIFVRADVSPYHLSIGSPEKWSGTLIGNDLSALVAHKNIKVETAQINVQQDAKKATWTGSGPGQIYAQSAQLVDLRGYLNAIGALVFDTVVSQSPQGALKMRVDCGYPCIGEVDASKLFKAMPLNVKQTVKIPLQCFAAAGTDFLRINTPILFYTEQAFVASFAEIRWVPGAARDADALTCDKLMP